MNDLPGSCSRMCISPCSDACQAVSIQAEQDTDTEIRCVIFCFCHDSACTDKD